MKVFDIYVDGSAVHMTVEAEDSHQAFEAAKTLLAQNAKDIPIEERVGQTVEVFESGSALVKHPLDWPYESVSGWMPADDEAYGNGKD